MFTVYARSPLFVDQDPVRSRMYAPVVLGRYKRLQDAVDAYNRFHKNVVEDGAFFDGGERGPIWLRSFGTLLYIAQDESTFDTSFAYVHDGEILWEERVRHNRLDEDMCQISVDITSNMGDSVDVFEMHSQELRWMDYGTLAEETAEILHNEHEHFDSEDWPMKFKLLVDYIHVGTFEVEREFQPLFYATER